MQARTSKRDAMSDEMVVPRLIAHATSSHINLQYLNISIPKPNRTRPTRPRYVRSCLYCTTLKYKRTRTVIRDTADVTCVYVGATGRCALCFWSYGFTCF